MTGDGESSPWERSESVQGEAVAGLVLAAGRSRRMGSAKLALPWRDGATVIGAVVAALRDGGLRRIAVVVGADRGVIERALAGSEIEFVENPNAGGEMLSSIQVGLRAMGDGPLAVVVTPGDLPAMQATTVRAVLEAWKTAPQRPCVPVHDGRRGHPVLLPRRHWPAVLALSAGESLRSFLRRHADEILAVPVPDAGIHADLDTPHDYRAGR